MKGQLMFFDSVKTLAVIAIIVLWASAFAASLNRSNGAQLDHFIAQPALDTAEKVLVTFVSSSQAPIVTMPQDIPAKSVNRVSKSAVSLLVSIGLMLIVFGAYRRYK
jgi:hypothetical protein